MVAALTADVVVSTTDTHKCKNVAFQECFSHLLQAHDTRPMGLAAPSCTPMPKQRKQLLSMQQWRLHTSQLTKPRLGSSAVLHTPKKTPQVTRGERAPQPITQSTCHEYLQPKKCSAVVETQGNDAKAYKHHAGRRSLAVTT